MASISPLIGQEADEGDEEQQRREQREKEVEGELRGQVQAVVRQNLAPVRVTSSFQLIGSLKASSINERQAA